MENVVSVEEGAEAFIELLNANSIDYIFLNPGTASSSIQEALAKYKALGKRTPGVILCLHEFVALSAAHGYYMVSGKPQVVLLHLSLGTQQLGGSLLNAQRGRAGVVICATRVPFSITGTGGRNISLHWLQEPFDQAGTVRGYVKWEYELRSNEAMHDAVQRAFQIAASEPCGPVYLSLPQELLSQKIKEVRIPEVVRHAAVSTPQVERSLIERAATILIKAKEPLIITGYSGRHTQGVASLVELAETLGARVVTAQYWMNFPTTHPLFGGFDSGRYLNDADVILVIDHDVPYIPGRAKLRPDARIIHFDIDPIKRNFPMWGFPADILVECDSGKALPVLNQEIRQRITPIDQSRFQARFRRLQDEHQQLQEQWQNSAISKAGQKPISAEWLCYCLAEIIDEDTIVVEEAVTNRMAVLSQIPRTRPGTFFTSEGACLGWGLGAALGAKLASPDSTVVSLVGDGTFIFGGPIPTLWAASKYQAPFLCIIFNNQTYNAPKWAIQGAYGEQGYSAKTGQFIGVDIKPSPNYALIAQACGGYGHLVEEPENLKPTLSNALAQVRQGKPAVVDVRI